MFDNIKIEKQDKQVRDKFNRPLQVGDICFRVANVKRGYSIVSKVIPVKVLALTPLKVKVDTKTFVDSTSLIKATADGLLINSGENSETN